MKTCSKCKKELPESSFAKNGRYLRGECKECHNIAKAERYLVESNKKRSYIDTFKTPCVKCGDTRKYVLDFHHLDRDEKEKAISDFYAGSTFFETVKPRIDAELAKCVSICSNCHREFHYFENTMTFEEYLGR